MTFDLQNPTDLLKAILGYFPFLESKTVEHGAVCTPLPSISYTGSTYSPEQVRYNVCKVKRQHAT